MCSDTGDGRSREKIRFGCGNALRSVQGFVIPEAYRVGLERIDGLMDMVLSVGDALCRRRPRQGHDEECAPRRHCDGVVGRKSVQVSYHFRYKNLIIERLD